METENILVLGGSGLVGSKFVEVNSGIIAPTHSELNVLDRRSLERYINQRQPKVVVNFAAYIQVDEAEKQKGQKDGLAYQMNALVPKNLAEVCRVLGITLVHISTDYVFDGQKSDCPYIEQDQPNPINWYGKTKWLGEDSVAQSGCDFTIARIEMPYRKNYPIRSDFARFFLSKLLAHEVIIAIEDQCITPSFVDDIAVGLRSLILMKKLGVFHLTSTDWTTPYNFAIDLARQANLSTNLIIPTSFAEFSQNRLAQRPKDSWLNVQKFVEECGNDILHSTSYGIKSLIA